MRQKHPFNGNNSTNNIINTSTHLLDSIRSVAFCSGGSIHLRKKEGTGVAVVVTSGPTWQAVKADKCESLGVSEGVGAWGGRLGSSKDVQ